MPKHEDESLDELMNQGVVNPDKLFDKYNTSESPLGIMQQKAGERTRNPHLEKTTGQYEETRAANQGLFDMPEHVITTPINGWQYDAAIPSPVRAFKVEGQRLQLDVEETLKYLKVANPDVVKAYTEALQREAGLSNWQNYAVIQSMEENVEAGRPALASNTKFRPRNLDDRL